MSAAEQLARQLSDHEFLCALSVIKRAGRSHGRACLLAAVVESFMGDLDGVHGLLAVEDAAAQLVFALDSCYAPPAELAVYGRAAA